VFRVGFWVFPVGFWVFRVGFWVFREEFREGFWVFRVGFRVFRVGSGCSGWGSGFYRHPILNTVEGKLQLK
jgi:hypothetical protein